MCMLAAHTVRPNWTFDHFWEIFNEIFFDLVSLDVQMDMDVDVE